MTVESGAAERTPSVLSRALFGVLPLLAAIGPLLTVYRGAFAFRLACAFIIAYAMMFLLGRSPWRGPDVLLLASTVAMVVCGLFGFRLITQEADNPYSEFLSVALGLLTALAARAWQRRSPRIYLSLCRGWVLAALFACALAVAEVMTGRHLPGYLESAAPDPAAAFGNPNALAAFLVMATVWSMPVLRAGGLMWRAVTWMLFLASAPLLFLTSSRLAMVMWIVLLGCSAWNVVRWPTTALASLGATLVPLGIAVAVVATTPRLLSYVDEISTIASSGGVRGEVTRQGLHFATQRWGLPSGPGSFEVLIVERGDVTRTAGVINAHNVWVEILVQYGALSLLLFLSWMVACVVTRSGAHVEIGPAVVTLLGVGLIDSSLLDDASLWLFVLTLATASRTVVAAEDPRPVAQAAAAGVP